MIPTPTSPTQRFSNRVANYIRYRPGYPTSVLDVLTAHAGLTRDSVVADIGSGTGISTELFLKHGNTVFAVEPNEPMRRAAELNLKHYPKFHSVNGTAESTTLKDKSIDLVVAAQAFHWFDAGKCKREFARVLKPGGYVALIWNSRHVTTKPFLREFESLLKEYANDYAKVDHRNINAEVLGKFFASGTYKRFVVYNEQLLDEEGLEGRVLSASYMPAEGDAKFQSMREALRALFGKYNDSGFVRLEYDTEIHIGQV